MAEPWRPPGCVTHCIIPPPGVWTTGPSQPRWHHDTRRRQTPGGPGSLPVLGSGNACSGCFYCGKYENKCRRPPHVLLAVCRHFSWSSTCEIPDCECCLEYVSRDSLAGFLLVRAKWGWWKFRLQRLNSPSPPQPRAPTAPRSPEYFFFPLPRVDRLAWNYFIIQTCLHVQLALVCTAPAEAHHASLRSNFLNLVADNLMTFRYGKANNGNYCENDRERSVWPRPLQ